jgi:hypothetical protein
MVRLCVPLRMGEAYRPHCGRSRKERLDDLLWHTGRRGNRPRNRVSESNDVILMALAKLHRD